MDAVRGAIYPIVSAGEGAHALDIECAAPFGDQMERDIADEGSIFGSRQGARCSSVSLHLREREIFSNTKQL